MAYRFKKHFTLDEAVALLPRLVSILNRIEMFQAELESVTEKVARIHHAAGGNGGGDGSAELLDHTARVTNSLQEITDLGLLVKDIGKCIIDFPHLRDGREVFLCWKKGEKTIDFWHEVNTGFKGRQPL